MSTELTIAERFRVDLLGRGGYLLEGEASGDLLTIQVQDTEMPYENETVRAWDIEDVTHVAALLLDATIGTPTKRGLHCDLEITQEGESIRFTASIEWPDLSGPLFFSFGDDSQMEFHNPSEIVTRAPRSEGAVSWDQLCASGRVQAATESVILYVERSGIKDLLDENEKLNLDAAVAALSQLIRAERPDQGIVRESVRWIGTKLDIFADEFAKAAGRTLGVLSIALPAYLVSKHVPELRHWVEQLKAMTEG